LVKSIGEDLARVVLMDPEGGIQENSTEGEIGVLVRSPVMKFSRATTAVREPSCPHHRRMIWWQ
jgi:hypothetical protein